MTSHDLNLFRIGDVVNVSDIPEYQGVTINNISDTGVTVSGRCGDRVVISGRSPAVLVRHKAEEGAAVEPVQLVDGELLERAPRGTYTAIMAAPQLPPTDMPFTIKEFADLNSIPVNYASIWVKDHCTRIGEADKVDGQRGKAPGLYKVND